MADEETKKVESESLEEKALLLVAATEELKVLEVKTVELEAKSDACKAEPEKVEEGSINRDAVLSRVATNKRLCFIRAWEESRKTKAENKAEKKLSEICVWENSKKAALEAELMKMEEQLEKKKADYTEKIKNKIALIHKSAEEKRGIVEAQRGFDILKVEEVAAKHLATGSAPNKLLGCF